MDQPARDLPTQIQELWPLMALVVTLTIAVVESRIRLSFMKDEQKRQSTEFQSYRAASEYEFREYKKEAKDEIAAIRQEAKEESASSRLEAKEDRNAIQKILLALKRIEERLNIKEEKDA